MANTIKLKNSGTSSNTPSSLEYGEIAINYADGKLFYKDGGGSISEFANARASVSDTAPSSPSEGDIWFESDTGDVFVYYDSVWVDVGGTSVANIAMSDTAPSSPVNGDFWFETDTGKTFVYYDDGTSQQWIEVGATSAAANGSDGAVQFASGGTFSSDASNFYWDDTNNRLGIGTTSPTYKLDVEDATAAIVSLNDSGGTVGAGTNSRVIFEAGGSTAGEVGFLNTGSGVLGLKNNDGPIYLTTSSADGILFRPNTTEAMRITSAGNVGIGTTTPSYKLDVAGTFRATGVSYFENTLICDSNNNTTPFYVARYTGTNEAIAISVADRDGYIYMNQDETSGAAYLHLSVNGQSGSTQRIYMDDNLYCGFVSKSSGSFTIDHPIPEMSDTHYLRHSFVEGPQADNLYRGRATLVDGTASVNIDEAAGMTEGTFVLLNRDIQCWVTNDSGWTAVRGLVSGNILTIEAQDSTCADSVSWLVMGERQDQHMYDTDWTDEEGHIIVEPEKDDPSIAPRTWLQHQEELVSQEAN